MEKVNYDDPGRINGSLAAANGNVQKSVPGHIIWRNIRLENMGMVGMQE